MNPLRWEWVDRVDKHGYIRAHLARKNGTVWGNTLCGLVVTNFQAAGGNTKCRQCLRWYPKEPHGSE